MLPGAARGLSQPQPFLLRLAEWFLPGPRLCAAPPARAAARVEISTAPPRAAAGSREASAALVVPPPPELCLLPLCASAVLPCPDGFQRGCSPGMSPCRWRGQALSPCPPPSPTGAGQVRPLARRPCCRCWEFSKRVWFIKETLFCEGPNVDSTYQTHHGAKSYIFFNLMHILYLPRECLFCDVILTNA